jgi:hypothetical protein
MEINYRRHTVLANSIGGDLPPPISNPWFVLTGPWDRSALVVHVGGVFHWFLVLNQLNQSSFVFILLHMCNFVNITFSVLLTGNKGDKGGSLGSLVEGLSVDP